MDSLPGFFLTWKTRSSAITTSISSPSCSSSAWTTEAGKRIARLLPHFETFIIPSSKIYIMCCVYYLLCRGQLEKGGEWVSGKDEARGPGFEDGGRTKDLSRQASERQGTDGGNRTIFQRDDALCIPRRAHT